jgi:hypothetical protein
MKKCHVCGEYKPLDEFYKKRTGKDGHECICRACKAEVHRREYQRDADRIKAKAGRYYAENKGKCNARNMDYYFRTQPLKPAALCECGCGGMANPGRAFILGHVNKGRKFDEEFRRKMSIAKKDPPQETRRKMSASAKTRVDFAEHWAKLGRLARERIGEKHPNWRGGIINAQYGNGFTQALKREVKIRDGWKCQNPGCLGKNKKLNCHHIDYDKMNNTSENLITLCVPCHCATNAHRDYWQAFYTDINRKHSVCRLVAVGGR